MLNSHGGSGGSRGADRKYQGVIISPDKTAAITFGEEPHEITFKNVAVHFPDRPQRTYPEFLDEMANRLDLTGLSPKRSRQTDYSLGAAAVSWCGPDSPNLQISPARYPLTSVQPSTRGWNQKKTFLTSGSILIIIYRT